MRARPVRGDGGYTVIEVMIALGVMAIVATALAGTFYAGLRSSSVSPHRTDAADLAARDIEAMRAVPYDEIGFYADEPGYTSTFEGYTTVTLGATTPAGTTPLIEPETPDPSAAVAFGPDPNPANATAVTISNIRYSLVRNVVWVNAQGYTSSSTTTTFLQAYKRITAQVSWADAVGSHTVRQDSIVYPGGLGSYAGPEGATTTTSTTTAAAAPCAPVLSASLPDGTAAQTQVNLSWTQPAGCGAVIGYTVQYSTSSSFPAGSTQYINGIGPGTVSYNVSGLSSSTTYWFQVVATGSGGTSATSNTASQTTAAASVPCSLNSLTVTGNTSKSTTGTIEGHTGNTAYMSENLTLVLSTSGTCTDSYAVSGTPPGGGSDQGSPYALSGSGGTYTTTVPSANETNWVLGAHTFRVLDNGASTSTLYAFDVCKFSSKSCP